MGNSRQLIAAFPAPLIVATREVVWREFFTVVARAVCQLVTAVQEEQLTDSDAAHSGGDAA